jgi:hypothetical protein
MWRKTLPDALRRSGRSERSLYSPLRAHTATPGPHPGAASSRHRSGAVSVFEGGGAAEDPAQRRSMFCIGRLVRLRSKTIFCRKLGKEPSGALRSGRARSPGTADIAAMPTALSIACFACFGLPPAGRDQPGGVHVARADRSAVSGAALLRFAANGGVARHSGP